MKKPILHRLAQIKATRLAQITDGEICAHLLKICAHLRKKDSFRVLKK